MNNTYTQNMIGLESNWTAPRISSCRFPVAKSIGDGGTNWLARAGWMNRGWNDRMTFFLWECDCVTHRSKPQASQAKMPEVSISPVDQRSRSHILRRVVSTRSTNLCPPTTTPFTLHLYHHEVHRCPLPLCFGFGFRSPPPPCRSQLGPCHGR